MLESSMDLALQQLPYHVNAPLPQTMDEFGNQLDLFSFLMLSGDATTTHNDNCGPLSLYNEKILVSPRSMYLFSQKAGTPVTYKFPEEKECEEKGGTEDDDEYDFSPVREGGLALRKSNSRQKKALESFKASMDNELPFSQ